MTHSARYYDDQPVKGLVFDDYKAEVERRATTRENTTAPLAKPVIYRGRCLTISLRAAGILAAVAAVALTVIMLLGAANILPMTNLLLGINGALIGVSVLISILMLWTAKCAKNIHQRSVEQALSSQNEAAASLERDREFVRQVETTKIALKAFNEDYGRWEANKTGYREETVALMFEKGLETYHDLGVVVHGMKERHLLDREIILALDMSSKLQKLAEASGKEFVDPFKDNSLSLNN